jgi:hypothetical protein
MRRAFLTFAAVAATALFVQPAAAQIQLGVHGAYIASLDELIVNGTNVSDYKGDIGVGGRVVLAPPLSPITGFASGTYYLADGDESVWTATLGAQLRVPLPVVKPYVAGGYQIRPEDAAGNAQNGFTVGGGVQLLSFFIEGMYEIGDDIDPADLGGVGDAIKTNRLVIKAGLLFG